MNTYLILLRGINVGGKNKMPMAELKKLLEEQDFEKVITFINSGNVIVQSKLSAKVITEKVEEDLPKRFKLDTSIIRILVLTQQQLEDVIEKKPKGFGDKPKKYYSDVIFLMGVSVEEAWKVFNPKEGVDKIWKGKDVIYSQRLGSLRTKSRLNKIIGTPVYKSMTIRNWNTTTKLLTLLEKVDEK